MRGVGIGQCPGENDFLRPPQEEAALEDGLLVVDG